MQTSRQDEIAAGDLRAGNMLKTAIARGEGTVAALSLQDYLKNLEKDVE